VATPHPNIYANTRASNLIRPLTPATTTRSQCGLHIQAPYISRCKCQKHPVLLAARGSLLRINRAVRWGRSDHQRHSPRNAPAAPSEQLKPRDSSSQYVYHLLLLSPHLLTVPTHLHRPTQGHASRARHQLHPPRRSRGVQEPLPCARGRGPSHAEHQAQHW
jgi:hypothetical protein